MIFTEEFVASAKLFVALGLSILIYMADGINLSQLAPFFPNEAELNKGKLRRQFRRPSSGIRPRDGKPPKESLFKQSLLMTSIFI